MTLLEVKLRKVEEMISDLEREVWKFGQEIRRAGIRESGRGKGIPVVCLDTGEEFASVSDAARRVGSSPGLMSAAIRRGGKTRGKRYDYK